MESVSIFQGYFFIEIEKIPKIHIKPQKTSAKNKYIL